MAQIPRLSSRPPYIRGLPRMSCSRDACDRKAQLDGLTKRTRGARPAGRDEINEPYSTRAKGAREQMFPLLRAGGDRENGANGHSEA